MEGWLAVSLSVVMWTAPAAYLLEAGDYAQNKNFDIVKEQTPKHDTFRYFQKSQIGSNIGIYNYIIMFPRTFTYNHHPEKTNPKKIFGAIAWHPKRGNSHEAPPELSEPPGPGRLRRRLGRAPALAAAGGAGCGAGASAGAGAAGGGGCGDDAETSNGSMGGVGTL